MQQISWLLLTYTAIFKDAEVYAPVSKLVDLYTTFLNYLEVMITQFSLYG